MRLVSILLDRLGIHDASQLLLVAFVTLMVVVGVLYKLGVIHQVMRLLGRTAMAAVLGGFSLWRRTLAWLPWPLLALAVVGLVSVALVDGPGLAARELLIGLFLLVLGVVSCLAYIRIDLERYEVNRGYKALHNPVKGQKLAENLVFYGHRAGVPLLLTATVAATLGFALFNHGLYATIGGEWYRLRAEPRPVTAGDVVALLAFNPGEPLPAAIPWAALANNGLGERTITRDPTFTDFLTYTLLHLLRVADLLDIANSYNRAHVTFVHQDTWPASTLLMLFKSFFTMILLQQLFTSIRYAWALTEAIDDFWSPHEPIYQRACQTIAEHGAAALTPLLKSVERAELLPLELRDRLADAAAAVGPVAVPRLRRALASQDADLRAVALLALARLNALPGLGRLHTLAHDSSEMVRQSLLEAVRFAAAPGAEQVRKEWAIRRDRDRHRSLWLRLKHSLGGLVGRHQTDPVEQLIGVLRALLRDPSALLRSEAATLLGSLQAGTAETLAELVQLVEDADESVRRSVAEVLGRIGGDNPQAVDGLIRLLGDSSSSVRAAAARALGGCSEQVEAAAAHLTPLLSDTDKTVREAVAEAIARIGTVPAGAHQLVAGLASEDNIVRAQAAEILGQIGAPAGEAVPALIQALADPNDRVRARAARSLGQINLEPEQTVPALIRALDDADHLVCSLAAEALGRIGPAAAPAAPALLRCLTHLNPQVRGRAARALGALASAEDEIIAALTRACRDEDARVRGQALNSLARLGRQSPVEVFLEALRDPDPQVRVQAAAGLGERGERSPAVTAALLETLQDSNDAMMATVAASLARVADPTEEVIAGLCGLLGNDTADVQKAALETLSGYGPAAAAAGSSLVQALPTARPAVRQAILTALVQIQPPEALEAFTAGLQEPDGEVRRLASAGLARSQAIPEEAIPHLVESLHDPEPQVRANAARALARLGQAPERAIPLLVECTAHADDAVRGNAIAALAVLATAEAEPEALRLLSDPSLTVRLQAARALAAGMPGDRRIHDIVREALSSEEDSHRRLAVEVVHLLDDQGRDFLPLLRTLAAAIPENRQGNLLAALVQRLEGTPPEVSVAVPVQ